MYEGFWYLFSQTGNINAYMAYRNFFAHLDGWDEEEERRAEKERAAIEKWR